MWTKRFPGGTRCSVPLVDVSPGVDLARLDWSIWRPARNRLGSLTRVVDIPVHGVEDELRDELRIEDELRGTVNERLLRFPPDIAPATEGGIESGIEIENATYLPNPSRPSRWEYSRQWNRLRGCTTLGPAPRMTGRFLEYLYRLNNDVRFAQVGLEGGDQLAVQVVLPCDAHWRNVAGKAMDFVVRLVLPQLVWWTGPPEVVDELLDSAGW